MHRLATLWPSHCGYNSLINANGYLLISSVSKNHTITQSSFGAPCMNITNGIDSGFQPVQPNATTFAQWSFTITNATTPLWFYCRQPGWICCRFLSLIRVDGMLASDIVRMEWSSLSTRPPTKPLLLSRQPPIPAVAMALRALRVLALRQPQAVRQAASPALLRLVAQWDTAVAPPPSSPL